MRGCYGKTILFYIIITAHTLNSRSEIGNLVYGLRLDISMSTMAVRVSLYPKMIETIPQRISKHPIGEKIREYSSKVGIKVWADLVVFSSRESIPIAFEQNIVEGTAEDMEYGEGQIEGHFTTDLICREMELEGWKMIALVQVTEDWIEIYYRR